jgi:hypothetical protein
MILLLPKQLFYTQVDSVIAPIAVIVLAALVVFLAATPPGRPPTFKHFMLVNAAFAVWFLMRNDVLPGWLIVTALIARQRLSYMVVPLALSVTIAVGWGLYKRPYRHEFNPMPTNTGEVLFLSLCEVPGTFRFPCTDDGYADWIMRASHAEATSQKANNVAIMEVIRYWFTYPVHFITMVWTKFTESVTELFWSGVFTRFNKMYGLMRDSGVAMFLMVAVLLSLAVNYQRRRSLVLGWILFFNMPLFYIVYASSGRFFPPANVSLVVAAVPLLFDRDFYRQLRQRRQQAILALACLGAVVIGGWSLQYVTYRYESIHYWAPLLDPRPSTIANPPQPGLPR